jgi:hypothetical protein
MMRDDEYVICQKQIEKSDKTKKYITYGDCVICDICGNTYSVIGAKLCIASSISIW